MYCIYTVHGFHFYHGAPAANWLFYPVEWFLARFTDQIVCINAEDQKRAEGFHLRRGGAVVRIPGPGLDLNRFQPGAEERKPLRAKLSLSQEDFVFLSVGELNKNKNHETVIRAFAAIKQERMKYLICGDGPERKRLNKLIAALGMEDSVFLCGYQENIERYYQCADCFLFPSLREGLGMAALEAMACGLPLIAADNRGSREYAGENAILCEAQNVVQFASAMERIVADRRSRDAMAAASQTIAERFSQEKTQAVMEQVYRRMDGRLHRTAG